MAGGVWVPVMASMKGFISEVNKGAGQAGKAAGSVLEKDLGAAGDRGGKSAAESMAKAMGAASSKVAAARKKEAGAASELRVAEEQLDQIRQRGDASAGEIMAAEAKVSDARRRQESMSARLGSAEQDLQTVRDGGEARASSLVSAENKVEDARLKSQAAADKIAVAEQKAQDARESAQTASDRVKAAEDAVAQARETSGEGSREVTQAERELERARTQSDKASVAVEKAEGEVTKTRADAATTSESLEVAELNVAAAQEKAAESAKDADGKISGLGDSMSGADEKAKSMNTALDKSAVAIGGVALGAAGALVKVGTDFDESFRTIRTGTGATGEAFEGLKDSALSVMDTVPAMDGGMSQISETLADLNTRLGLTDEPLETMTGQMVALSNMGVDADINAVSKAMNGFGIEAKDMPAALDELFQVSQATGLTVTDLANSATKAGPQLRGFGFTMQDSAALVGQMDKAGLDADGTLQRLSRAMSTFAEEGRDAPEALKETITEIDGFIASGDEAAAMNLASDLFGTRGAAQFVDAVKSGALSVEDFMAATGATEDTILGVSEETRTMGESFQLLKQKGETALQPIASQLVDALIPAIETGAQKLEDFMGWIEDNQGLVKGLATAVGIAAAAFVTWRGAVAAISGAQKVFAAATALSTGGIKAMNAAMKANVIGLIVTAIAGLVAGLVWFFTKTETGQKVWQGFMDVLSGAWEWLKDTFTPVFQWMGDVISSVWDGIKTGASWLWESVLQPIFGFIGTAWELLSTGIQWYWENVIKRAWDTMSTVISWLWNSVLQPTFGFISTAWEALSTAIQWAWNSIIKPAWDAVSAAASWLWNTILKPVFSSIGDAWSNLGSGIRSIYDSVIKPAWDAVGNAIQWLWDNVFSPVVDRMKDAWSGLGDGIRAIYDNVISPAFDALKTGLQKVRDFFGTVVDGIKGVWEKLRGILAKPINFMIGTVYNDGILKAWNTIAGFIPGLNEADPLSKIPEHATGGRISGPGTGTSDDVLMWGSNGEHMLTADEVRRAGGHGAVYAMRDLLASGENFTMKDGQVYRDERNPSDNGPLLPAYKDGGEVRPAWEDKVARGHEWAKQQDGKPYLAGNQFPAGADCSGYMSALAGVILNGDSGAHWTTVAFPAGQGQTVDAAGQPWVAGLGQGMSIGMSGGPASGGQNGHTAGTLSAAGKYGAVNVESGGANSRVKYGASDAAGADDGQFNSQYHLAIGADGDFEAAGGPSPEQKKGFLRDKVKGIFEEMLNPIKDMFASAIGEPPPEWLGIPPKAMSSSKDKIVDFVFDRIEDLGNLVGKTYDAAKEMGSMVFEWGKSGAGWVGDKVSGLFRDQGGWIPNGLSVVRNETGRPEAVLNWEQVEAIKAMIDNFGVGYSPVSEAESILRGVTEGGSTPQQAVRGGTQVAQHVFAEEMGDKSALEHGVDAVFDFFGMGDSLTKKLLTTPANELAPLPDWYSKDQDGDTGSPATDTEATDTTAAEVSGAGVVMEDVSTPTADDVSVTAEMPDDFMANPATAVAGQSKPLVEDLDTIDPDRHKKPEGGPEGYVYGIVQSAQDHGLPASGAKIGVATALVEAGDPLQMWANNAVPESLNFPHDAVGSDHDSVGLFQQRDNGAWGTVAQRMDPYDSAGMFFDEMLRKFPNWQSMDPGAVAQGVQVSAFPDRYATKMGRAETLVADAGLYDAGGTIPDGALAVNLSGSPEHVYTDDAMSDFVDATGDMKNAAADLSESVEPTAPLAPVPVAEAPSTGGVSSDSGGRPVYVVVNVDGDEVLARRVDDVEDQVDINTAELKKQKTARRAVDAGVRLLT
ncbi:phage tail tape measure protein [Corynebacterium glyciniphilum]|uniref:phage tail tape measure protein n=1 Tax=Corynebacterium glyciniphilum TaxID=1404244 RepID=UPI00264A9BFB|nr:phage tail tape measure protein [Corynebacterium glyciniphilum]MDN6707074.1 phage tail tape measure protein [Corynebacterium glyciniphilum]